MARIRTIKPEFFTSDDITGLSPLARLLYIGLWCEADREGRFEWKPTAFKRRYLPDDACDIQALCQELIDARLVVRYGHGLAYVPTFRKHQHLNGKETPSKLESPDAYESDTDSTRRPRVDHASRDASGRDGVASLDATSLPFPSLPSQGGLGEIASMTEPVPAAEPTAAPSTPAVRPQRRQGPGAGAGSYPRDHLTHGFCGSRFCVSAESFAGMVRRYGDDGDRAVTGFLQRLNDGLPAEQSPGGPVWVLKHFDRWLETSGRVAPVEADDDGDALHRKTLEFDRRQREIRESLPPVEVNLRALAEGRAEARAAAAKPSRGPA